MINIELLNPYNHFLIKLFVYSSLICIFADIKMFNPIENLFDL